MNRHDTGVNLLFGVIALQLDLIDAERFAEACSAWTARKDASLGELLLDRGWITAEDRAEIERVLERKLDRHRGDARRSLELALDHSVGNLVTSVVREEDDELGFATGPTSADGAGKSTVDLPTVNAKSGTRERFRLVRMYAKGGLGQVWLARDPVLGREVALKELRPERANDPTARARFLREARITGKLEHPGIVTVHELAPPGKGHRSFYAMQLVRGRTLREAIHDYHERYESSSEGGLELHALLDDFVAVCNAIAYAHSRGVIHRDLKGQNVVLGDFGEVVVLDWGLAKVIGQNELSVGSRPREVEGTDLGGESLTLEGQRIGTPGFMAPEQAEGRHDVVGIGSDIYGLGAILYEILTGQPPFADSGVTETLRRVSEEDPPSPSAVRPGIPGALEAISLKALAKRPEDRFASASDMAQEVRRWLADEPVSVYREPTLEKLGRWGRRHRTVALAGAALVASVVAALIVVVLARGREQARTRAALASEARQRRRAEANFTLAREAVDQLYARVLENPRLSEPALEPLRLALIRTTNDFYLKLIEVAPEDSELKEHLAESYLNLSRVTLRAGNVDQSSAQVRQALKIYEALAAAYPARDHLQGGVAQCHLELAECFRDASRPLECEEAYQHAIGIWTRLAEETRDPLYRWTLATACLSLGSLYRSIGALDKAEPMQRKAFETLQGLAAAVPPSLDRERVLQSLARSLSGLANLAQLRQDWAEAESRYRQADDTLTALIAAHPKESYQSQRATLLGGLSRVREALGRRPEARELRERALGEWAALAKDHPETIQYQDCVANEHIRIGEFLEADGSKKDALEHYQAAGDIWKTLALRHSGRPDLAYSHARALFHLGRIHAATGRRTEATQEYRAARAIWEKLTGSLLEEYRRDYHDDLTQFLAELDAPEQNPEGSQ